MSKQVNWQQRQVATGRCRTCGKPRVTAQHCARHAEAHARRVRKKRNGDPTPRRIICCGTCKDPGHTWLTCARRKLAAAVVVTP